MPIPTIFFGSSSYVLPIIEMLHRNYDLKLVVTTEKEHGTVPTYCQQNNIPFISVTTLKDETIQRTLSDINAPFAVLADFALLVPTKVLDIFPKGIVNVHPSLLPKFRGPTPGLSAILQGETITGVSIIRLDSEIDHGPIIGQGKEPILPDDTSATLYPRLFERGTKLLEEVLPHYLDETRTPQEQDHSQATYSLNHLTRESGYIDLSQISNFNFSIEHAIRAFYPWPGVWTKWQMANGVWRIVKLLPENKIQVEGKKPVSYKDFINGYPEGKEILEKLHLTL